MINDEILFLLSAHGNIAISHWYSNAAICQSIDIHNRWPDIRRSLNLFFFLLKKYPVVFILKEIVEIKSSYSYACRICTGNFLLY